MDSRVRRNLDKPCNVMVTGQNKPKVNNLMRDADDIANHQDYDH